MRLPTTRIEPIPVALEARDRNMLDRTFFDAWGAVGLSAAFRSVYYGVKFGSFHRRVRGRLVENGMRVAVKSFL